MTRTGTVEAEKRIPDPSPARIKRRNPKRPGQIGWLGSVPALIIGLLFTVGPLIIIVIFSFLSRPKTGGGVIYDFSLEAYRSFLVQVDFLGNTTFDPRYLAVFGDSLVQASVTSVVCLVLAFPLALWMATRKPRMQNVLVLLVTIPFWTNLLVRTYAWMLILNENGIVNTFTKAVGIGSVDLLYTPFASQLGLIYTFLPFMVLPIYSSLAGFDFRLAEAAYDLGAKKMAVVRRIILPIATPGIVSGLLLVFMPAFGSYVQPVLLGGGKLLLIGNLIAAQFGASRNWPFGAALSVIVLVMLMLTLMLIAFYSRRSGRKVEISL
ncbi:ABC transporter permease [Homoserinimonas sp. OAct 916]|uniref:ABC transporter permease n=1 Tax=Homoserinimonas sp. OAct 916 TaxID=2211450 RepID=UPI000DBE2A83|nr:ABC transporter permease [Homoserinimonas sp. OAct 916]